MAPVRDIVPAGHQLCGPFVALNRADIFEPEDAPVLLHRCVAVPFLIHVRGPFCLCSPVPMREADVQAAGFGDRMNYFGACH